MSLESRITLLAQGIGNDVQSILNDIGTLANLTTTDKSNLVNAINEAFAAAGGVTNLGIGTNDAVSIEITSSSGANATISAATAVLAGLMAAADKSKLDGIASGATANSPDASLLNRANHTGTQLASTISDFATEVLSVVEGDIAPAALNTLDELAQALGDDPAFATTITTALGNRIRVDGVQSFTAPQQLQACQNIGVGDPERDFLNDYTTARDS